MQEDVYNPHTWLQECLSDCLYSFGEPFLTRWPVSYMRMKALQQIAEFLKYEDENSQYICIGAAQKALSMLCCWIENPNSDAFKRHLARVADFLWVGEDGMKVRVIEYFSRTLFLFRIQYPRSLCSLSTCSNTT